MGSGLGYGLWRLLSERSLTDNVEWENWREYFPGFVSMTGFGLGHEIEKFSFLSWKALDVLYPWSVYLGALTPALSVATFTC